MAKKPAPKANPKTKAKAKVAKPKAKAVKMKAKAVTMTTAPAATGMWKILEQKKLHQKEMEQARSEGRAQNQAQGHSFHANPRDPRFTKFAGPRRKAG